MRANMSSVGAPMISINWRATCYLSRQLRTKRDALPTWWALRFASRWRKSRLIYSPWSLYSHLLLTRDDNGRHERGACSAWCFAQIVTVIMRAPMWVCALELCRHWRALSHYLSLSTDPNESESKFDFVRSLLAIQSSKSSSRLCS